MHISYSGNGKQDTALGNQVIAEHKVPRDIDILPQVTYFVMSIQQT
jgi:hypothetical protein